LISSTKNKASYQIESFIPIQYVCLFLGSLALSDLSADGLTLGRAVDLLGLCADLLDVGEISTDDGAGDLGGTDGTALGDAVGGGLAVDAAVGAGPGHEAGVLLAHVQTEALLAGEGQHGLRRQEREGHVAAAVTGVDGKVGEFALNDTHGCETVKLASL
jgi:hypothetical protein